MSRRVESAVPANFAQTDGMIGPATLWASIEGLAGGRVGAVLWEGWELLSYPRLEDPLRTSGTTARIEGCLTGAGAGEGLFAGASEAGESNQSRLPPSTTMPGDCPTKKLGKKGASVGGAVRGVASGGPALGAGRGNFIVTGWGDLLGVGA